jgi:hypothetical protein
MSILEFRNVHTGVLYTKIIAENNFAYLKNCHYKAKSGKPDEEVLSACLSVRGARCEPITAPISLKDFNKLHVSGKINILYHELSHVNLDAEYMIIEVHKNERTAQGIRSPIHIIRTPVCSIILLINPELNPYRQQLWSSTGRSVPCNKKQLVNRFFVHTELGCSSSCSQKLARHSTP